MGNKNRRPGIGREFSRRRFLVQSSASTIGAWALGTSGILGSLMTSGCTTSTEAAPTLVRLFSPDHVLVAGRPQRVPFATVAPVEGSGSKVAFGPDDAEIPVRLMRDGKVITATAVTGRVVNHDHVGNNVDPDHQHAELYRYYPLRVEFEEPGIYDLVATFNQEGFQAVEATTPIQVFDPASARVQLPGDPFPTITTPTVSNPSGVDTLCTRVEPCAFHTASAADLLGQAKPFALLVATPALCSTAYCGPVLDTLIEAHASLVEPPAIVHIEVYANTSEVNGNFADPNIKLAPAVVELGLEFEPSLFIVGGDGVLLDRIDNIFDLSEATEALHLIADR